MKITKGIRRWALFTMATLALHAPAQGNFELGGGDDYNIIKLKTDTLPSLNISRTGHSTFCLDGELTVLGGHTHGFIPSATAEYFRDGSWHIVPLVYPHDHGTALCLRSGKVFLAGGHREPLGIGQLFSAELYDPATHSSNGFGCMDKKRAFANAIEMANGQILIAGNWYADDGIEMFSNIYDPFTPNAEGVKDTAVPRAMPYILKISADDAIIFSSLDNQSENVDCSIVDRLKGPAYREPFLSMWKPLRTANVLRSYNHFIGNEAHGRYEWLLPVENDSLNRVAIARVTGATDGSERPVFSLLPTQQPVPDSINGKQIIYWSLVCDQERAIAYLIGENDEARIFVVAIPYSGSQPSPLTIYVTEPQPIIAQSSTPVLTPEGDLVFAGGHLINNFSPSNTVLRLRLGDSEVVTTAVAEKSAGNWWLWLIISCLVVGLIVAVIVVKRRRAKPIEVSASIPAEDNTEDAIDKNLPKDEILAELFSRIEHQMQEEKLYLNANLRASDLAAHVGSNNAYVSAAINSQRGCSFSQYLTTYRISYAQKLMRDDPDRKISTISTLSGFSTDSTFFRAFRAVTGMSPKEWLSTIRNK